MSQYNRRQVFTAACLGMLVFGIMMTTLGSVLPSLFEKYGLSGTDAGSLFLTMTFGMFIGSIVFGPIVDRFGYKTLLILSSGSVSLSLFGIGAASHVVYIRLSLLLIGFGGGVINGATNAIVSDISEEGKSAGLSLLGVFFGLGAFGMPFVLGQFLNVFTYETIIAAVGAIVFIPLIYFVVIQFPSPKIKQGFPLNTMFGLLRNPLLVILGFILFFESGIEIATGGWVSSFFASEFSMAPGRAVLFMSYYWLGLTAARIALNFLLKTVSPTLILFLSYCIGAAGGILLIFSASLWMSVAGLVLIGIGYAAVYPVILARVSDLYPELTGTAFSVVLVMALTGGMIFPWIMGIAGDSVGLSMSFSVVPSALFCEAVLFALWLVLFRKKMS